LQKIKQKDERTSKEETEKGTNIYNIYILEREREREREREKNKKNEYT